MRLDPCNSRAHYYEWRIDSFIGRTADSRRELDLAHRLDPEDSQIQRTWESVQQAIQLESEPGAPQVTPLKPLRDGFFAKTLDCDGIPVRSAAIVDSDVLVLACGKIRTMLQNLPDARRSLVKNHAELHIIGEFQGTTDLPENARWHKSTDFVDAQGHYTDMDARTRGVGGLMSSCGEENLLSLPGDRYWDGSDICIHEFAHDIMNNGLTGKQYAAIKKQYDAAIRGGLWKKAYTGINADEYWADLSMWYFGSHGAFVPGDLTTGGPDALRAYDPGGFALLASIYGAPGVFPGNKATESRR